MNGFAALGMVLALASSQAISTSSDLFDDPNEGKLIFCYFSDVKMSPKLFSVYCDTNSSNGVESRSEGFTVESPEGQDFDDFEHRLWLFSIPKSSYSASFKIVFTDEDSLWSSTLFSQIASPVFIYDTSDYSTLKSDSRWGRIHISYSNFALYVLSWIDPYSSSSFNGYNAYPQINDGIYSWINDETDPETVCWDDPYLGETNVREKWELIQSNYVESAPNKNYGVVQIIIGAILLLASLFLLAIPTWRLLKGRQAQ